MQSTTELRNHVRALAENRPGIYRMFGPADEVLYVGKSVRVRTRILSYFRAQEHEKAFELIHSTERIDWEYVPNEFSALLREMKLIQQHRPRFNVQHKRKCIYAFVKITREPAPRLLPVRRVVADGSTYYGPFPALGRIQETVREIAHVLGLRDCPGSTGVHFDDQLEVFGTSRTPACLRADLHSCLAPCAGRCSAREYSERVSLAHRFMEGRTRVPLRMVQEQMAEAAARLDFEYARMLRDRLQRLERFQEDVVAFRGRVEALSFVYRVPGFAGKNRVYLIRRGRIRADLAHSRRRRDRERVVRRAREIYTGPDPGPLGLTPEEAAEILLVARWFRLHPKERKRISPPAEWLASNGPRPPDSRAGEGSDALTQPTDKFEFSFGHGLDGEPTLAQ